MAFATGHKIIGAIWRFVFDGGFITGQGRRPGPRKCYGKHPQEEDLEGPGLLLMAAAIRESEDDEPELDDPQSG